MGRIFSVHLHSYVYRRSIATRCFVVIAITSSGVFVFGLRMPTNHPPRIGSDPGAICVASVFGGTFIVATNPVATRHLVEPSAA